MRQFALQFNWAVILISILMMTSTLSVAMIVGSTSTEDLKINNAGEPNLYWIGFNDTAGTSRLDQTVDVDNWYNFTCVANYSQGWDNCLVEVRAWYDGDVIAPGIPYPTEDEGNRNLAFRLEYDVNANTYQIMYPILPSMEIMIDPLGHSDVISAVHPTNPGVEDEHTVELQIWLGNQLRVADGDGWGSGDVDQTNGDINPSFQDPNSWNFNVTIRDRLNPTVYNTSYSEFGINPYVDITATGEPIVEAPPGSAFVPTSSSIEIIYSANSDYWVNVSVSDLLYYGVGPAIIPAVNIDVQNADPWATDLNSDIFVPTTFPGAGIDMQVWGQIDNPLAALANGTTATGPWVSNYNAAGLGYNDYTELDWWVTIPSATPQGVYFGDITITIEDGFGNTVMDQSTQIIVNAVYPLLYEIGFEDTSMNSKLDQVVDTDKWYNFTLEANYTYGWENCEIEIMAWYDDGNLGMMSNYPIENEINRNRAFRISYYPFNGTFMVNYPIGPEIQIGAVSDIITFVHPTYIEQSWHRVELPIYLGSELINADGQDFVSGDPAYDSDPNWALQDSNSWDFKITLSDACYPTVWNISYAEFGIDNTTSPEQFMISLFPGWNLISIPLEQADTSLTTVLNSIDGHYDILKYYDITDKNDPWKTYRIGASTNDLFDIDHTMGIWIHMLNATTLVVEGTEPISTNITLYAGWNLVGYPTLDDSMEVANALWGTGADRVEVFDPASPYLIKEAEPDYLMQPGEGYWVHVIVDTVWTIDW